MGLFKNNFNTPGPGIPKNLPPKKGLRLLWDIFIREFWNLIKLNLLFVIFSIPIVTIAPAYAAMCKVTTKMVWDKNIFVFDDFWEAFKKNIKCALPFGIVVTILITGLVYGAFFYYFQIKNNTIFVVPFLIVILFLVILSLAHVYLYPLIVLIELKAKNIITNSFLLGLGCVKQSFPCALVCGFIFIASYWYFPISIPIMVMCLFSIVSLINSFAAWYGIEKYVISDNSNKEDND